MHTRVNYVTANNSLETVRTLTVHMGSQQLYFLKTRSPIFDCLKPEKTHATFPLNNNPIRQRFYQAISEKKFGLLTYAASDHN
jgi:hypothetical protein